MGTELDVELKYYVYFHIALLAVHMLPVVGFYNGPTRHVTYT